MSIMRTLTINGVKYNVTPVVPANSVSLVASAWVGDGEKYSQVVALSGVTPHTKVDLQPTSEQLAEFHHKVLAFVAENDGGVVTVYAIGDKPTGDHTIQTTLTEVESVGKIRGNTVGTTMPRPDWNQTDPKKANYIKNKPTVVETVNGKAPDENGNVEVNSAATEEQIAAAVEAYLEENPVECEGVKTVNGTPPDENGNVTVEATGSGVYVGSGDMPDGYNVQIDPTGEAIDPDTLATKKYVQDSIAEAMKDSDSVTADSELSTTSTNPIQNKAVAQRFTELTEAFSETIGNVTEQIPNDDHINGLIDAYLSEALGGDY